MKIKKNYLKPGVRVHQFRPTAILAGSETTGETQSNESYDEQKNPGWTWQ